MERRERIDAVQLRAEVEHRLIHGLAAVYYNADDPGTEFQLWNGAVERIQPGAFDRALRDDDVVACFNHDISALLGRTSSGTLRLKATDAGLAYECELGTTTTAMDVEQHAQRGDLGGSSFAFSIREGGQEWTTETTEEGDSIQVRNITDVRLYDVSPVTNPAYQASDVGVREARAAYEAARQATEPEPSGQRQKHAAIEVQQNEAEAQEKPATVADQYRYRARLAQLGL